MRTLWLRWADLATFLRPVADDQLPEARVRMARAAYLASLVNAIGIPGATALSWLAGFTLPVLGGVLVAAVSAVFGGFHLFSRSAWGARRPEWTLFGMAIAVGTVVSFSGFFQRNPQNEVAWVCLIEPLGIAAFAPWRPSLSLALVPILATVWVAGIVVSEPGSLTADKLFANLAVVIVCGIASAMANQSHRHGWLRLEQAQTRLAAVERVAGAATLTAGIAHEIKTPIASVMNALHTTSSLCDELARSIGHPEVDPDDLRAIAADLGASVAVASAGTSRAASYIAALREKTRGTGSSEQAPIGLAAHVAHVISLMATRISAGRADVHVDVPVDLVVHTDRIKLEIILSNLLANALEACDEHRTGCRVVVSAARAGADVCLAVTDDGPGVPAALRTRIFEPMFTTRGGGSGTGLGLAIARDLAIAGGGSLALVDTPVGARFELVVPGRPAPAPAAGPRRIDGFEPGFRAPRAD